MSAATRAASRAEVAALAVAAVLGCGLLTARPALVDATRAPTAVLAALFAALLVAGVRLPMPRPLVAPARVELAVCAAGVLAFAAGRVLAAGHAPTRLTVFAIAMNTLAAVAEEAWFRRVCYGLLATGGTAFAIASTSVLFALVHVALYGLHVIVVDLAAGAVLGWQRAATGSWRASAVTHVAANLFVLL